ncbi:MAG: response regulator [Methylococcaceae bacterium]
MSIKNLTERDIVLIVDDLPNNLNYLSTALTQAGFLALVALDGQMALEQLKLIRPNIILLDAVMPGMDGFELCQRIQDDTDLRDIPVIFMTALDDTEHVIQGLRTGAVDYVIKPVRPGEVIARIHAHLRRYRNAQQARLALETTDQAAIALDENEKILWLTEKAKVLMSELKDSRDVHDGELPMRIALWISEARACSVFSNKQGSFTTPGGIINVTLTTNTEHGGSLLLLKPESRKFNMSCVREQFSLTSREAEVLMWVAYGKTNRQIGEILEISPRTVNKHLDHVFVKLGVETRAAATAIAITRIQGS